MLGWNVLDLNSFQPCPLAGASSFGASSALASSKLLVKYYISKL